MRGPLTSRGVGHPAQVVVAGFAAAIVVGTLLLWLPAASDGPGAAPLWTAFFTATASVTLGGMSIVDAATYWSPAGQAVILVLVQLGGLGIVTSASLLFLVVSRRIGLRGRLAAQTELHTVDLGGTRRLVGAIIAFTLAFQAIASLVLMLRFWLGTDLTAAEAAWNGVFHGVAAVNNAGISILPDGLAPFAGDPVVLITIGLAVIAGGLGFPVWLELIRSPRAAARWSLHTKLTLATTGVLLLFGMAALTALEWENPATIGGLPPGERVLAGMFTGTMPRTAGFTLFDYDQAEPDTTLVTEMLMFAGGGSGSVAGGIKVTTLALIFLVVWAELRGETGVTVFRRRIPLPVQRQALTIAVLGVNAVVIGTLALMLSNTTPFSAALLECVGAFSTAGISAGVTDDLNHLGQAILIVLMFLGRVGPLTLGVALVLRERERLYSHPEERPLVG
jgi:trk system potassium uptake protein TrkH